MVCNPLKCIPLFTPRTEDLVVFEFGSQTLYLLWRTSCFLLVTLLVLLMPKLSNFPSYLGDLKYMHGWILCALMLGLLIESVTLLYILLMYPSWKLEKPKLPLSLRLVWLQYCITYPNIFSCTLIYVLWFTGFSYDVEKKEMLQFLLTFYAIVHVLTTAIPSHLCHLYKPIIFNLAYLIFNGIWQLTVSTSDNVNTSDVSNADNYTSSLDAPFDDTSKETDAIYKAMDWSHRLSALGVAVTWIMATASCHVLMVFVAWGRRKIYFDLRKPHNDYQPTSRSGSQLENYSSEKKTNS